MTFFSHCWQLHFSVRAVPTTPYPDRRAGKALCKSESADLFPAVQCCLLASHTMPSFDEYL